MFITGDVAGHDQAREVEIEGSTEFVKEGRIGSGAVIAGGEEFEDGNLGAIQQGEHILSMKMA